MKRDTKITKAGPVQEEIDLWRLAEALWRRAWAIILAAVIVGGIAFSYASLYLTPLYSSSVMGYINSKGVNVGNVSISGGDINTARTLTDTYSVILKNRTTMEKVIAECGVDYTPGQLLSMTTVGAVNNTEVFRITVQAKDPDEARDLANSMARILVERVSDVIDGSSMRIVDSAVSNHGKVFPNVTSYTVKGVLLGAVLACAAIVLLELLDDVIHDESYLMENYNIPVLAKVPNLSDDSQKKYSYYQKQYGYGEQEGGDSDEG